MLADLEILLIARQCLEGLGLTVECTPDPDDGVALMRDGARQDLAVVGAHLRTAGGELLSRVIEERLGLPVVPWSAQCSLSEERGIEIAAECGLVVAPVNASALRTAIARAWRRHRHQVELDGEVERLRGRLEDRKIIERAKWSLVERLGISEPEAMRRLQKSARSSRRPLRVTAMSVLEASETMAPDELGVM